ncbi:hypothetical protein [Allorhizobium sonneratiae]|uniref:hypothetical protein n=1 Tax=Allorhizobium sonneratiae TaxID=2934936 RepID=UPI00203426AF|nr:hypothetical protein [Allorhizobium sonneratiae]
MSPLLAPLSLILPKTAQHCSGTTPYLMRQGDEASRQRYENQQAKNPSPAIMVKEWLSHTCKNLVKLT